jgi:putative (di)nucleoside polyphosphate hydrolase
MAREKIPFEELPYRPCVGVVLVNRDGLVFMGQRIGGPEHVDATHSWQMPQGGIDAGETPLEAAIRELYEETNVRSTTPIAEADEWLAYDLPRRGRAGIAARRRNGSHFASPARTTRSM